MFFVWAAPFIFLTSGVNSTIGLHSIHFLNGTKNGCIDGTCKRNLNYTENYLKPRMHSSRMRTVRSSSRLLWGGGVCPVVGGVSQHALEQTPAPLWTEWLTDRCKNITFPQLRLRTVISIHCGFNRTNQTIAGCLGVHVSRRPVSHNTRWQRVRHLRSRRDALLVLQLCLLLCGE